MEGRLYRYLERGSARYALEHAGALRDVSGDIFGEPSIGAAIASDASSLTLLPPVVPSKIVCVGLNYKDHAAEQNKPLPAEPLLFIKPSTSVVGPGQAVLIPAGIGRVDHEAELGIVIRRRAKRVRRAQAWDYVLGLTCVNDVTARDLQNKGAGYTRAKGFDTFAPIGPCVTMTPARGPFAVEGRVNGTRRQSSDTSHLIFPIDQLVEYISFNMTLEPGDIISTGTPAGIGPLVPGDTVAIRVEGVGELTNPVKADEESV
jgi:2-keto-4-pentenoate hydratase/2-oxohepta-3-ene-1,7-dioic acid hydratase in catechol pathway